MEVRRFDVRSASEDVLHQLHELTVASQALDRPDEPAPTYDLFVGRLHSPGSGLGEPRRWIAEAGGQVVGVASVLLPDAENQHLGLVSVLRVAPAMLRRGIGTLMLRTLLLDLIADGRTAIESWSVVAGTAGERWAQRHGFRRTHAMVVQELLTRQADPALWEVPVPSGYRLVSWRERCPEELVESFAVARTAIADAPAGEATLNVMKWTAARVREAEQAHADAGIVEWAYVAIDETTGAVAALTLVEVQPHRCDWVYQSDTAVLAEHRGHGLGRGVKAAMTRSLVAEIPELERMITNTATSNVHMIATNHAVGYTDVRVQLVLTQDVRALAQELGIDRP